MRTYIITLVAGIAIGFFLSYFLSSVLKETVVRTSISTISPAAITAYTQRIEAYYQVRLDSLYQANNKLERKISTTRLALRESQQQYRTLEADISELIFTSDTATDTTQLLLNCDTLASMVTDLLQVNGQKDSLYENLVTDFEQQLSGKDSLIACQQQQNDTLKKVLDKTVGQQQDLIDINQQQQQQLKRQRSRSKLLSVILFIAAGFTAQKIIQ